MVTQFEHFSFPWLGISATTVLQQKPHRRKLHNALNSRQHERFELIHNTAIFSLKLQLLNNVAKHERYCNIKSNHEKCLEYDSSSEEHEFLL